MYYDRNDQEAAKRGKAFLDWMDRQMGRDDPIGDLSTCIHDDRACHRFEVSSRKRLVWYMRNCSPFVDKDCPRVIRAAREAWDEFERRTSARSGITPRVRYFVMSRDGFKCCLCGQSPKEDGVKLEVDHKKSVASGGDSSISNLWTLCFRCNRGKHADSL